MKKLSAQKLIVIVLVVLGVLVTSLLLSGTLVVSLKNPGAARVGNSKVCSSELITQYNTTFSAESQEQYNERLGDAFSKVNELKDADSDPNCVYIQYAYYIQTKDTEKARDRLDVLKKLANQDSYITGELANPQGLENAEQTLIILETSKNPESGPNNQEPMRGEG